MNLSPQKLIYLALVLLAAPAAAQAPRFEVTYTAAANAGPVTGRLVLLISKTNQNEPRFLLNMRGPAIAGVDVDALRPGQTAVIDDNAVAYPGKLSSLPPGDYFAQAVLAVYTQVHRADGKTIWVQFNDGQIDFFNTAGGNLYSDVQPIHVGSGGTVTLSMSRVMPKTKRPADTEWLKYVSIQSKKLSAFWGRPVFIHAAVLLPKDYAAHPETRYPSVYTLGHSWTPMSFTTDSAAARRGGVNPATGLENGYATYKAWSGDNFPRVIAISLIQQTPYFADSYSVNSANNGPYGDAVVEEVIPWIEEHFRIIPKPYARHLEGASTSGWQTLALALRNPDYFGGAWVLQPDPIDFTKYVTTDIYQDTTAFTLASGQFVTFEKPFQRTTDGQTLYTMRQLSLFEAVLGTHGRSNYQLGAWEAVYGPVGVDGYPVPLWDKLTGKIDRTVATYMRDNGYDLRAYAEKNWSTLGPQLQGKLHFFAGDTDDYWLNQAVYKFEDFLKTTTNPRSDADFTYGHPNKGHAWHAWTWADFIRLAGSKIKSAAPAGENTKAWNY